MHPIRPIANFRRGALGRQAFTLVEMMMATAISAIVMTAVVSTYILSLKGFRAIENYAVIHADGRRAIDFFGRDMRAVSAISSFGASNMTVTIPTAFSTSGSVISNKTVSYSMSKGGLVRADSDLGTSLLATNIYQLTFSLYDRVGSNTAVLANAKGVQVDIKLRKYVISQIQSEDYLSARLDMRNKL